MHPTDVTIVTRIVPATDTKPTRVIARFGDVGWGPKSATVAFDYALRAEDNHFNACRKLWMEWSGTLDAEHVAVGDIHSRAERVHLLKTYPGEVDKITGNQGGAFIFPGFVDKS